MNQLVIPGITNPNTLDSVSRARTFEQFVGMVENVLAGNCPFCTLNPTRNPVIISNEHWVITPCSPPEKNTKLHFLAIPRNHVSETLILTDESKIMLMSLLLDLQMKHHFNRYGILIRDGDARCLAGTIEHLHVHLMVPNDEVAMVGESDGEAKESLLENRYWKVWQTLTPEQHTLHHFILQIQRNVYDIWWTFKAERIAFFDCLQELRVKFKIKSFGIVIRSDGNRSRLRVHMIVPDGTGRVEGRIAEGVASPFYKVRASDEECIARAIVFEKLRQGEELEALSPAERALVEGRLK